MSPTLACVPRADIVALLAEGHSDREIARRLHTDRKRVARIREAEDLPGAGTGTALTLVQKWRVYARPVSGGHVQWTGAVRGTTPNLVHGWVNHSARRIAFEIGHGRQPVGRVLSSCGHLWCVAPEHATDRLTRAAAKRSDRAYTAIFGRAA